MGAGARAFASYIEKRLSSWHHHAWEERRDLRAESWAIQHGADRYRWKLCACQITGMRCRGTPNGIRTRDLHLERVMS